MANLENIDISKEISETSPPKLDSHKRRSVAFSNKYVPIIDSPIKDSINDVIKEENEDKEAD
jgi:hypothetical protein